jgi:Amt family ammonium transporter
MAFQMMFAIITPALIVGAFAERISSKDSLFSLRSGLFSSIICCALVWGNGGWLSKDGALDFAGGTVIHVMRVSRRLFSRYFSANAKERHSESSAQSSVRAFRGDVHWFGWFGFNAGSALAATESRSTHS